MVAGRLRPGRISAVPGPKPRLHLPYKQWPVADRLLWQSAFCNDDLFAEATGARLARASQERCLWAWRRFLGFLANQEATALNIAPAERLTIERVRALAKHLAETNAPTSVASSIDALYTAARAMMSDRDWRWLRAVKARLYKAASPTHFRNGPVVTSLQLLDLGLELMDASRSEPGAPIHIGDAVRYRDGLMVAMLAFIPIRRKNLAALEIGRHVVREGDRWFVIIPREETKTGTPIEFSVPELLVSYLAFYLDVVRPRILRRAHLRCALGEFQMRRRSLTGRDRQKFRSALETASGSASPLTTHGMRRPQPGLFQRPIRLALPVTCLRTAILRTTIKHYNRARGVEASRTYSQVIAGMRRKQN